jgi:mannose-6-phosphate isomerase-like protein (cupin superfamily)
MARMTTLHLTPTEQVTIRIGTPRRLVVDVRYLGSDGRPPLHLHPQQTEHFEVVEGTLHALVGGESRIVPAGGTLDIPRVTPHTMWAPDGEVRARWETTPAGRTADWFRALDRLQREGRVGRNGMPGVLAFATLLTEYDDVFRLAVPGAPLVQGALAALAPIGRLRGYRAVAA